MPGYHSFFFKINAAKQTRRKHTRLPSVVTLSHTQNLDHANEDIQEVELKADTLVHNVTLDKTSLGKTGMVQDLLDVVEGEATEDGETTVQPDLLRPHECSCGSGRENKGCEARESDDGDTGKKGTTEVQVLLLLGSSSNESNGTHHADSVEASTSQEGRGHEQERGQDGGLSDVEGSPETIFHEIAMFKNLC